MGAEITINNLIAQRGSFELCIDSLSISPGEVFAILGTTGSGKTVLLESIAGAFPLSSGTICLQGIPLDQLPVQNRQLGILYQDHALFPHMTVRENIEFGAKAHGMSSDQIKHKADELIGLFGIDSIASNYPGTISGGESQRCALARALMVEPEILLLDEPFSALDPATKNKLYQVLNDVHDRFGCTLVFVTHDFNEAHKLADRVGIVLNGRLRLVRAADQLFNGEGLEPDIKSFLEIL